MASKQPPHSAVLESQGSMRPVAVRARAFSQIEDSSTPTVIPNYMALTSMTTSPSSSAAPSSPPRSAKTLEIKGLVSPSRSPTRASQAASDRAKIAAKAVAAITSPVSKAPNSMNTSASPNGAPTSKGRDLFNSASPPATSVAASSSTSPSPARSLRKTPSSLRATDTTDASRRASSQQWRDEAARLSQRVLELERENSQLRRMPSTTLPPRTVSHGERIESSFVSASAGSGAVSLNGHETQGNATHYNSNNNGGSSSNGDKEAIRTRMRKSNSVASGFGYTGLTVAEAVAASHRSRSKRTGSTTSMGVASASGSSHGAPLPLVPLAPATQPLQKYKSGYWNEQSNVKSSFSCNNLADMENRALAIDKPQLLQQQQQQQQQRPLFQLQKANSTNTKSNAKSHRDAASLMRSTTASSSSSRKNDSFQRSAMEPSGEEMAAQHKQQLAIAKSFHGTQVLASAQRKDRRKDLDIDELPSDSDSDSESDDGHMDDDKVHVTSPRSYFESSLRGMGGSFRMPNRSQSLAIGKRPTSSDVRLWVGSWNMGAADPFVDKSGIIDEQASAAMLQEFVPHGYHVYVLGLQEGVSENAYHAVAAYLNRNESGTRYYRLELKNSDSLVANKNHPGEAMIDAVRGRGDGAFVGTKFTGLAVFYAAPVQDKIKLLRAGVHKFNLTSGSKGGVAAALMINQTSIVFVNCHLDARNDGYRREQIRNLNANLGKAMGHANFDLTEQFHHVVWMGDMNYRIVHLDPDIVLHMLEEGRNSELHDKFDGLLNDRRNGGVFDGFTEPNKFPDFYPTYKKFPKRGVVNYRSPSWTRLVYRVLYKEPFYKGGKVKKRVPGWCDRILIHSLLVSDSKLVPEKVLSPFDEEQPTWIDNYRSVNEGVGMDVSDHSPVYATFTLSFPQQSDALTNLSPRLTRRNSRSLSSVSTRGTQPRSTAGGSYFDNPSVVRRIAANVPNRPVSTVLRVFNMQLFWNDNVVVPKRTRVVAPLIGEDMKQCDVIGERCQGTNGLNLSLNAVVQHTRPLEHLHMLVWVKNETISGHCTLSLKRIARQDEGGEVKFRVPLYNNSMRLYYDGHPLVLVFSVRSKTFAK